MSPTKRGNGQCTCIPDAIAAGRAALHQSDCPSLYPLQPQPGDTPACTCNKSERFRRGESSPRTDAHYPECPRAQWLDAQRGAKIIQDAQPEALSGGQVNSALEILARTHPTVALALGAHIAALESGRPVANERIALLEEMLAESNAKATALEADNAARVERLSESLGGLRIAVDSGDLPVGEGAVTEIVHYLDDMANALAEPHPGAALLAEHEKALKAAQQALVSQQAESHTLRRAFLHERNRADAAGAPPEHAYNARWAENLLADEAKALKRARNEGREEADKKILKSANPPEFFHRHHPERHCYEAALSGYAAGVNHALDTIRALREPEE